MIANQDCPSFWANSIGWFLGLIFMNQAFIWHNFDLNFKGDSDLRHVFSNFLFVAWEKIFKLRMVSKKTHQYHVLSYFNSAPFHRKYGINFTFLRQLLAKLSFWTFWIPNYNCTIFGSTGIGPKNRFAPLILNPL